MAVFFTRDGVFSQAESAAVRQAMDLGQTEEAEILGDLAEFQEDVRRAQLINVDEATLRLVEARLDAIRDGVAESLGLQVTSREGAGFLRYQAGGFYRRHVDWARSAAFPEAADRRVTVVVFLGAASEDDPNADFSGGSLRLFPGNAGPPLDIVPRSGRLVAFPATVPHEVLTVRRGVRDTIVDWFR
jgi:predicted 2-oxoglutarate/Fe(II)-dependent dioxygenase YbiX